VTKPTKPRKSLDALESALSEERIAALERLAPKEIRTTMKPEEALTEWLAAHDAERAAAKEAARVRCREYAKWPAMPKRMPRNAVNIASLPKEERDRINEQCARDMAPINEAEAAHRAAQERLAAAIVAARAALALVPRGEG
jgi:hypothetical protein